MALVSANVAVFVLLKAVWAFAPGAVDGLMALLAMPSGLGAVLSHPWCVVTYAFVHIDFWHMLVNCLWLMWFGLWLGGIAGNAAVVRCYVAGALAGAAAYLLAWGLTGGAQLVGASAATLSVVAATLVMAPKRRVELPGGFAVSLKMLSAAPLLVLVCASMEMAAAQTAAHLGGLLAGVGLGVTYRRMARKRSRTDERNKQLRSERDALADKVRRLGYESLSRDEKVRLFSLSERDMSRSRTGQQI